MPIIQSVVMLNVEAPFNYNVVMMKKCESDMAAVAAVAAVAGAAAAKEFDPPFPVCHTLQATVE